jgi:hypothetical protein
MQLDGFLGFQAYLFKHARILPGSLAHAYVFVSMEART